MAMPLPYNLIRLLNPGAILQHTTIPVFGIFGDSGDCPSWHGSLHHGLSIMMRLGEKGDEHQSAI